MLFPITGKCQVKNTPTLSEIMTGGRCITEFEKDEILDFPIIFDAEYGGEAYHVTLMGLLAKPGCTFYKGSVIPLRGRSIPNREQVNAPSINAVSAYPNPAKAYVNIAATTKESTPMSVILFSPRGLAIEKRELPAQKSHSVVFETGKLAQGLYSVLLVSGGWQKLLRVTVE